MISRVISIASIGVLALGAAAQAGTVNCRVRNQTKVAVSVEIIPASPKHKGSTKLDIPAGTNVCQTITVPEGGGATKLDMVARLSDGTKGHAKCAFVTPVNQNELWAQYDILQDNGRLICHGSQFGSPSWACGGK